ncbi:tRNA pseudouridine(38-40) synthase TruA [Glaciecola sp. 1036]|uniref:tRNA pseudouridine(38-40) synthase TruA n=1 Tax=Alteromonadaceae TaxID=72275 RepID=UPI003D02E9A2
MRLALGLEYQGNAYKGWQRQSHVPSVQAHIENCLSQILCHDVEVACAGRTDAGVHATNQIVHFDTQAERPDKAFTLGMNALLPQDIAINWVKQVSEDFHARFSATARRYRYIMFNSKTRPGIFTPGVTHVHKSLNAELMHQAAQCLVGEHDFTSFRASLCQSKSPFRDVKEVSVTRTGPYVVLEICANAFLHHMVRNIVGSLIEIGAQEQPVDWMQTLLDAKDRTLAAATAKPNGLYLVDVTYPEHFELPNSEMGPLFLFK